MMNKSVGPFIVHYIVYILYYIIISHPSLLSLSYPCFLITKSTVSSAVIFSTVCCNIYNIYIQTVDKQGRHIQGFCFQTFGLCRILIK